MLARAVQGIAFGALLLVVAMAGAGGNSVTPTAVRPAAAQPYPVAAAAVPDPRAERIEPVPVVVAPPIHLPAAPAGSGSSPVRLLIPSLDLNAQVEALGLDGSGALDTPHNIWNVGWYRAGPAPGAAGDAVIDGHVGLPGSPLVFSGLAKLAVGAEVITVLGDGSRRRFAVTSLKNWPANSRPTGLFSGEGPARLSLITCSGSYDAGHQTYADRLIVEASYAGPA